MSRILASLLLAAAFVTPIAAVAQDAGKPAVKRTAGPAVGKGQKVCRYKFPDGEKRVWVCAKDEPCCAWDAIKYVKCGSTITKCL